MKHSLFTAPELVWVKIYSSADKSLTGIKRGKVSVLTYWTALSAPQRHFYSVLMAAIVHFSYPKAQPVNIQVEITLVLHKIQTPNLLVVVVLQFCPCVCMLCVYIHPHASVCMLVMPGLYSGKALTKTLTIILSALQPWKQFSAPFRLVSWKLQTKAFWLQCKSLAYKGLPIQIRLRSAPRLRLKPASALWRLLTLMLCAIVTICQKNKNNVRMCIKCVCDCVLDPVPRQVFPSL